MPAPPTLSTPCFGCGRTAEDCPPDEQGKWFCILDGADPPQPRWYCHHHNISPEMQTRQKIALRYHHGS